MLYLHFVTAYCYRFGKRFINALFLAIYSLMLLRIVCVLFKLFVFVLLQHIDSVLFSALLAHLRTNFCAINTCVLGPKRFGPFGTNDYKLSFRAGF